MIDCVALSTQTPPLHLHNTPYILQQNALLHVHVHVSVVYQSLYPYPALLLRYLQPFLGYFLIVGPSHHACEDSWEESQNKKTIRAENEVEANKLVNNYRVRNRKSFAQEKKVSRVEDTGVIAVCVCIFISLGLESGRAT